MYLNGQRYWVNDLNGWTQRAKKIVNQRVNITQWSNYLLQRVEILSQRSKRVNSTGEEYCESTGKINSKVELLTSAGRDIESTISTGKEYCESTGKYNNRRKILWKSSQTHENLLSSSLEMARYFHVHSQASVINCACLHIQKTPDIKPNLLRKSPILYPTVFAFFSLL